MRIRKCNSFFLFVILVSQTKLASAQDGASDHKTSYACEGDRLNIDCGLSTLEIVRANFGRFSIAICNEQGRSDYSVNCLSPNTLHILKKRCFTKGPSSSCSIVVDAELFGSRDLCPETPKYLEVHYYCTASEDQKNESKTDGPQEPFVTPYSTTLASSVVTLPNLTVGIHSPFDFAEIPTGKTRRIPITPKPKNFFSATPSVGEDVTNATSHEVSSTGILKQITSKFLSSSIASTNIMDTSDLPITVIKKTGFKKSSEANTSIVITTTMTTSTTTRTPRVTTTLATTQVPSTFETAATSSHLKDFKVLQQKVNFAESHFLESADDHDEDLEEFSKKFDSAKSDAMDKAFDPPQDGDVSNCRSAFARGMTWPTTRQNQTVSVSCPYPSSTGTMTWTCGMNSLWLTSQPTTTLCRSSWVLNILRQIGNKQTSLVHLANEIEHQVVTAETLFAGDLLGSTEIIKKLTSHMRTELDQIPTSQQRRAVVTEIVQRVSKAVSIVTSLEHATTWQELGDDRSKRKLLTNLLDAVENFALLLPEAVSENEEVTISSSNVILSVKKVNFHHMGHLTFPSPFAVASKEWSNFSEHLEIPSLVLMDHMQRGRGITEVIFIAFKSLDYITQRSNRTERFLNSPVISLTMGRRVSKSTHRGGFLSSIPLVEAIPEERLPEPVTIYFQHKIPSMLPNAVCVLWDVQLDDWSSKGCSMLTSNETHSKCECTKLATYALIQVTSGSDIETRNADRSPVSLLMWFLVLVLAIGLSLIMILGVAVSIIFIRKRRKESVTAHKRLESSPSISASRTCGEEKSWIQSIRQSCCSIIGKKRRNHLPGLTTSGPAVTRWNNRDESVHSPTFYSDINHASGNKFSSTSHRQTLQHLDLEPISTMTLRGQEDFSSNLRPTRGETSEVSGRSRNGLSLNLQTYRRPVFPKRDVIATPERPLLDDEHLSLDNNSHIYMEVLDSQPQLKPHWQQKSTSSLQPIQRPLHCTFDSSSSSQSSGYGSSVSPHQQLNNSNYDNVRGDLRGAFVRFQPEGGVATIESNEPRNFYSSATQDTCGDYQCVQDFTESSQKVFLHDSQFI